MYDFESWGNHLIIIFPILAALAILQTVVTGVFTKKPDNPAGLA